MTGFVFENDAFDDVNIKVIGVGGGGGNALNCMVDAGVQNIEYIAINTDAKALNNSKATTKFRLVQSLQEVGVQAIGQRLVNALHKKTEMKYRQH